MKKAISLVLMFALLLSLCACGQNNTQPTNPSTQGTTAGTEGTTEATTETPTTPPATEAPTTPPATEAPTTPPATEAPTTPPTTEAPTTPPTTCSHSWSDATCTAPKTCSKCGATEGNAAGHSYSNGACSVCGAADPNVPFTDNTWSAYIVRPSDYGDPEAGGVLSVYNLMATQFQGYAHKDYYANDKYQDGTYYDSITYDGKTYYDYWFSSNMNGIEWDDQGDTVTVKFAYNAPVIEFILTRTGEAQFTVTSSNDEATIPVGTVFQKK